MRQARQTPVLINYSVGRKRFEKTPDDFDWAMISTVEDSPILHWFPTDRMPDGEESRRNDDIGLTHVHHFYTKTNLHVLAALWSRFRSSSHRSLFAGMLAHSAANPYASRMRRFRPDKKGGGPLAGTLYVASLITTPNVILSVQRNAEFIRKALVESPDETDGAVVFAQSSTADYGTSNFADYIFTDPPFGGNLMYSELNFLWESWLKVFTENDPEAIENKVQGKELLEYQEIMSRCFERYHQVLKPGRWMTVEFHNSKNSVWNAIQESLQRSMSRKLWVWGFYCLEGIHREVAFQ